MDSRSTSDPRRLDVLAFAAASGEIGGEWPIADFPRLPTVPPEEGLAPGPVVAWRASGRMARLAGAGVQPMLHVEAQAEPVLRCQRCLQPLRVPVQVDRRIAFVDGEDAAAGLDAYSEDDVLARVAALDLHELVEDELLLTLPLVPRHDVCPDPPRFRDPDDAALSGAGNPFAALSVLKRGLPSA